MEIWTSLGQHKRKPEFPAATREKPRHPEIDAQGMCAYCGKPFCKDCLVEVKGRMYCKNDLGNVLDEAKQSSNAQPTINITNSNDSVNTNTNANVNGGFYGAPRKSKTVALILCILHQAPLSMGFSRQALLEWVAISSSRGSSLPRDQTYVSCVSCIGR